MKLGIIGFGDVGFELSCILKKEGFKDIYVYDPMSMDRNIGKQIFESVKKADVSLYETAIEVVRVSDIIIATMPDVKAIQSVLAVEEALCDGKIYADISGSTVSTKKKIADIVETKGAAFVDIAITGGLSAQRYNLPMLVSGSGSNQFISMLSPYGITLTKVGDNAGDANVMKLMRSIARSSKCELSVCR